MRIIALCLLAILTILAGNSLTAKADTITLQTSSQLFCFQAGNGTGIRVTTTTNCGQLPNTNVTGNASSTGTPASGTYTLAPVTLNGPVFTLINPQTNGNTTTMGITPGTAQFNLTYGAITGPLTLTSLTQVYNGNNNDPITTAIGNFGGGTGNVSFSFTLGGGQSLAQLFTQCNGSGNPNCAQGWDGFSGVSIRGSVQTVPEPTSLLLLASGLMGVGCIARRRLRIAKRQKLTN